MNSHNRIGIGCRWREWIAGLVLVVAVGGAGSAELPVVPSYQLGEVARADVITPVSLSVPADTRFERPMPEVFRFCSDTEALAVASLNAAFAEYRRRFQTNMTRATRGRPMDARTVEHPTFARYLEWYRAWNPEFPLSDYLARLWAVGPSDEPVRREWEAALRAAMRRPIRADSPSNARTNIPIRLVAVPARSTAVDLPGLERRATMTDAAAIRTVTQAQAAFVSHAVGPEKPAAPFLSRFIDANCFPDSVLTERVRLARVAASSPVMYHPGDILLRAGQVVDARAIAALSALADARRKGPVVATASPGPGNRAWHMPSAFFRSAAHFHGRHPWVLPLLAFVLLAVAGMIVYRRRTRLPRTRYIGWASTYTLTPGAGRGQAVFLPLRSPRPPAPKQASEPLPRRGAVQTKFPWVADP